MNSTNLCDKNNVLLDQQLTKLHDGIDVLTNYLSVYKEQSLDSSSDC